MRIADLRPVALLAITSLILHDSVIRLDGGRLPTSRAPELADIAVSPPLLAAAFHPEGYAKAGRIRTVRIAEDTLADTEPPSGSVACIREAWSARILAFAG